MVLFGRGESGIRDVAHSSDRKKSAAFSPLFRSPRSEKMVP